MVYSRVFAITSKNKITTAYLTTLACVRLVVGLMVFRYITDVYSNSYWRYAAAEWMVVPYLHSKIKLLICVFLRLISGKRLFFFRWVPHSVRGFRWLQEDATHRRYVNRNIRVCHRGLVHLPSMEHAQDFRSSSCDRNPVHHVLPCNSHHADIFSTATAVAS